MYKGVSRPIMAVASSEPSKIKESKRGLFIAMTGEVEKVDKAFSDLWVLLVIIFKLKENSQGKSFLVAASISKGDKPYDKFDIIDSFSLKEKQLMTTFVRSPFDYFECEEKDILMFPSDKDFTLDEIFEKILLWKPTLSKYQI